MIFPEEAVEALGHYPVCAFTDNKSIRSEKAKGERWKRWEQKLSEKSQGGDTLGHSGASKGKSKGKRKGASS